MEKIFTIALLSYVVIDIIVDTLVFIAVKRNGYTLKDLARQLRTMMTCPKSNYDYDEEWYDNDEENDM